MDTTWDDLTGAEKDVLLQLLHVTWDGNLASKQGRSDLVSKGLAARWNGYQVITVTGLQLLDAAGKLSHLTR
jgi:hypothetical protein